jgi:hypothetical protein
VTLAPTPASTGETTSESSRAGTEIENQCVICPNGPSTGFDDYAPYADDEYDRTCAQLIQNALTVESGTADCGWYEFGELECCETQHENPCVICPDGATAGDDYVPPYDGNFATCGDLIEGATQLRSESDACSLYDIDVSYCCPPLMTNTPPTPAPTTTRVTTQPSDSRPPSNAVEHNSEIIPVAVEHQVLNNGKVNAVSISAIAISSVAGISLMALAVLYFRRKNASKIQGTQASYPGGVMQMPEGSIPTAVAMQIDPETVLRPPYVLEMKMRPWTAEAAAQVSTLPPPYAPHASAPPFE